ncbi:hypothetical protein LT493_42460 [Streptomyces tricolor]|nr:hypothetical protein [Streptomyces tricolor]
MEALRLEWADGVPKLSVTAAMARRELVTTVTSPGRHRGGRRLGRIRP